MDKNIAKRSCTAGIPDFVPRKSTTDAAHHSRAKSTYYAPDIPEQTLPPVTPCFSQADIDEFLSRKPKQYKMTERDYKELGRNTLLGLGSLFDGLVTATVICAPVVAEMMNTKNTSNSDSEYRYGSDGTIYKGNAVIFEPEK
ncbi:hypothetical protein DLB95_27765 [Salmonella enterica subsp. diarizonae]|uniref:Uncharacterized protein n=1 Tax=Salmonella diarizonae TaxID=59204 RepID=A0A5Y3WBX5_SALDZ|nr:hypothetical protein [Salmonella enterica]EBZ8403965.1 hypothetical protein [Salmonella enterica subsp. enterica serovar Muenchen]ECF1925000.1 hypothetical protein [Salmonella enterica subsp. enterica serovar Newport]ECJ4380899.1 hypothetical protein [Salmonella enterica subsp. diarizonae]HEB6458715.1 hypothetical protein [Salmonella enterica subsp. enterica serovar Hvittingfoss]